MSNTPIHHYWFATARSTDLGTKPLARKILGQPIVLFRNQNGAVSALLDQCPHRGYALSKGPVQNGEIKCPYHGWRFNGSGACTQIPGLDESEKKLTRHACARFSVKEENGIIFVYGVAGESPQHDSVRSPLALPFARNPEYHVNVIDFGPMKSPVEDILENFMDSMHPPFVHGSFLNQDTKRSRLEIEISTLPDPQGAFPLGVEGVYVGETAPKGSLAIRLFAGPHDGKIQHIERFLAPTIHQFEYRIGKTHFISTQFLTPESDTETRLIATYQIRSALPRFLARLVTAPLLSFLFRQLIRQDYELLEALARDRANLPLKSAQSTELDALGLAMLKMIRLLKSPAQEAAPSTQKTFRVPMWL